MDISSTVDPNSQQLNADHFISGPKTYTVDYVNANPDAPEQPVNVFFKETKLPFRPCKSMRRVMIAMWGSDASTYAGKSLTLYRDPKVKWGGMEVGGIRISHMSDIERDVVMSLTASKAKRAPYTVKPIVTKPAIDPADTQQSARNAAAKGEASFKEWWRNNPDMRAAAKEIIDELKAAVAKSDAPDEEIPDDEVPL